MKYEDYYGVVAPILIVITILVAFIDIYAAMVVFFAFLVIIAIIGFFIERKENRIRNEDLEKKNILKEQNSKEKEDKIKEKYESLRLGITKNIYPQKKEHSEEILEFLNGNQVDCLYHFTDFENIDSIKQLGGLMSWKTLEDCGVEIPAAGGDSLSRRLDESQHLEDYVHLSFCQDHPMAYRHIAAGRKVALLKIYLDVATWQDTLFTDMNATDKNHAVGENLDFIKGINLSAVNQSFVKKTDINFKQHQAEVLVKRVIPKEYIINLENPDILPQLEYENGWYFESSRFFTEEEKREVISAMVVRGDDCKLLACFFMKSGSKSYLPISTRSSLKEDEIIDIDSIKLLTLYRQEKGTNSFFFPDKVTTKTLYIE